MFKKIIYILVALLLCVPICQAQTLTYTFTNSSFELSDPPAEWTVVGTNAVGSRSSTQAHSGTYSGKLIRNGTNCNFRQQIDGGKGINYWKGKTVTFTAWVWASAASRARLSINDGVGTTSSTYHTGGSGWEQLSVQRTLDANATILYVYAVTVVTGDTTAYADDVAMTWTDNSVIKNVNGVGLANIKNINGMTCDLISSVNGVANV